MSKVRIVGGEWRSRLVTVPDAIGLRPTPDRVRETLFNWLGQDLDGLYCLDLFAGSGALGLEAASRGATEVVMVELALRVVEHLRVAIASLKAESRVRLVRGDATKFAQTAGRRFDIIFLDPPYNQGWLERIAPSLEALLAPGGRVYAEAEHPIERLGHLCSIKAGKAGQVHYHLLAREDES